MIINRYNKKALNCNKGQPTLYNNNYLAYNYFIRVLKAFTFNDFGYPL